MTIKSNWYKTFALIHVFILQTFPLLVTFNVFEIRKNLDLRKILSTPKIFLKSRFHCTWKVGPGEVMTVENLFIYLRCKCFSYTLPFIYICDWNWLISVWSNIFIQIRYYSFLGLRACNELMKLIYSFKVTVLEVFQYSDFIVYIVSWAGMTEFLQCHTVNNYR